MFIGGKSKVQKQAGLRIVKIGKPASSRLSFSVPKKGQTQQIFILCSNKLINNNENCQKSNTICLL